ncbi:MAG TPA: hypothetical protein VMR28_00860 [Candidatus Saccharimonadales bacterium]|nr:hypothetical protein [Candidatus Saccharimonadales bacterium]
MSVVQELPPAPHHEDMDLVTDYLALTYNELNCLALAGLRVGIPTTESELHHEIMVDAKGMPSRRFPPSEFGVRVERMPSSAVVTERAPEGGRRFIKTETGELATALAGHLLNLSKITSVPTKVILGTYSPKKKEKISGKERLNSFEARLIVLHGLYTTARDQWQKSNTLYETLQSNGVKRRVADKHMRSLRHNHLVEREKLHNPRGGDTFKNRIRETNGFISPAELIGDFLTIVGRFAILDPTFIREGLEYADDIVHDDRWVPGLVQRAIHKSDHFGKSSPRPAHPKPHA